MIDLTIDPNLLFSVLKAIIIIVASVIAVNIFNKLIRVAEERVKVGSGRLIQVKRFFQLLIYSIATILMLWTFNINVTALIAGLGVGALIVGFGLQNIIENWISGLLIVWGRTYEIGDVITIGELTGVVSDISLRTTKLNTYDKNEIIIPNSNLLKDKVINQTGGKKEAVISFMTYIDYIYDVEKAKEIIKTALINHSAVVFDEKKKREIRFVIRVKEWALGIECLFWINDPANQEFVKSELVQSIKIELNKIKILPPIPASTRSKFLDFQN